MTLDDLATCFEGIYPSALATRGPDGMPNVTYLSHVVQVDDRNVAISNQFFAKTAANMRSDPRATLQLVEPRGGAQYILHLTWQESIDYGPLFEHMKTLLSASSAQAGLADVMRLRAVDILRVEDISLVPGSPASQAEDLASDRDPSLLPTLAMATARLSGLTDSSQLICGLLDVVHTVFGHGYAIVLLNDADREIMTAAAAIGYGTVVVGAEVAYDDGLIGSAARAGRSMRINDLSRIRRMGYAVIDSSPAEEFATRQVALPGAPDAMSQIAVPMSAQGQLQGILFVESDRSLAFDSVAVAALEILAQCVASILLLNEQAAGAADSVPDPEPRVRFPDDEQTILVVYHAFDHSIFIDHSYVIKGLAGRLLAYILSRYKNTFQDEFSNREIRLAMSNILPDFKDNLETRLLLLRRRLDDLGLPIRLHHIARGRMRLVITGQFELIQENET